MIKTLGCLLFVLFCIVQVNACTCIEVRMPLGMKVKTAFSEADLIFTGNLVKKKLVRTSKENRSSGDLVVYTFEVLSGYKGVEETQIISVTSAYSEASCGYNFEEGQTYLVYSNRSDYYAKSVSINTKFITGLCRRNQEIANVKPRELRILSRRARKNANKN